MPTTVLRLAAICVLALVWCFSPALASPGDVDGLNQGMAGTYVLATAVQPDGKVILAGSFTTVLGQSRNNIARLNADGTLDSGFNPNVNGTIWSVVVQADGKVIVGGASARWVARRVAGWRG